MEDWWRQNAGIFVFGAFIALTVLGVWARRYSRRMVARAADNAARGVTLADTPLVQRKVATLATEVRLDVDGERAEHVVGAARLPRWWKHPEPRQWSIPLSAAHPDVAGTLAVLVDDGTGGSVLRLQHAGEMGGMPTSDGDWGRLRRAVLKAAAAAGVRAEEVEGPPLVRTPYENPLSSHRWERAGA